MNSLVTEITGITAGVFTAASMLPQLIKTIKKKEAEDLSVFMLIILLSGLALWIVYGFMKNDIPIVATNIFSLVINIVLIFFKIKYSKNKKQ